MLVELIREYNMIPENNSHPPKDTKPKAQIDYENEYKHLRSLSPQSRAQRAAPFYNLLYASMVKNERPTHENRQQAIKLAEKYFTENPTRTTPDPDIFKEIIPQGKQTGMGIRMIENIISQDIIA